MESDGGIALGAPSSRGPLLLVDDDALFARVLARALSARGFVVHTAASHAQALAQLEAGKMAPDFAILDLNLGAASGLKLIGEVRRANPTCRIVILTGYASISTAVDAIKLGADQYLAKPVEVDAIVRALVEDGAPDPDGAGDTTLSVSRLEWEHIQRVLAENGGNVSATARALKMHRRTLQRKLTKRPVRV
ncbi:MAG: response regulator transcription factor [Burkholderiaceae bacterium]|nr:response regulator transcription factor [Burkholderiaceae bacterium]